MSEADRHLIQIGMRAVVRDLMDWIPDHEHPPDGLPTVVYVPELRAYLLAQLITAGAYDDLHDDPDVQEDRAFLDEHMSPDGQG